MTAVQPNHIHLIAACGTGMGSLRWHVEGAWLSRYGFRPAGLSPMSTQLQAWGIPLYNGFSAEHLVPTSRSGDCGQCRVARQS